MYHCDKLVNAVVIPAANMDKGEVLMSKNAKFSKKTKRIITGVIAALLAAVIVVVGVLFFPHIGKSMSRSGVRGRSLI